MASKLVCVHCGTEHEWTREEWGRHPATHGHGPEPVCTELVPDHRFPLLPNGEQPMMSCHGPVIPARGKRETA